MYKMSLEIELESNIIYFKFLLINKYNMKIKLVNLFVNLLKILKITLNILIE